MTYTRHIVRGCLLLAALALPGCEEQQQYAKAFKIEHMSQTIGGPAAAARPGDLMLENDRLRAVVHGRHNFRSTFPIANGSLVDLDIQRPQGPTRVGQGKDAFYELGPMVNLKINNSRQMEHGSCEAVQKKLGSAPCPKDRGGTAIAGCARVSLRGKGENLMGALGLLDLAIIRDTYNNSALTMTTDYTVCPGEPVVRVSTSARFSDKVVGPVIEMEELKQVTGLMDILLGEHTGQACDADKDCKAGEKCAKLLIEIPLGGMNVKMRRCRTPTQRTAGVLAGDFTFFSAKVNVFIPGGGFDHDGYIRSVFDSGGDTFSKPLTTPFVAGVGDGVSYAYFSTNGSALIPVFTEAFTAALTARYACPTKNPKCLRDREVRFSRFVSVGRGDIASALAGFYQLRGVPTAQVEGHVIDLRARKPLSGAEVFAYQIPRAWRKLDDKALAEQLASKSVEQLMAQHRAETRSAINPVGVPGIISHFKTDLELDHVADGSFSGPLPVHADWCDTARCRYALVAHSHGRPFSRPTLLNVSKGQTAQTTLVAGDTARVRYSITDAAGQGLPAKLTFGHCFPECAQNADCPKSRPVCDLSTRAEDAATVTRVGEKLGLCVPVGGYSGPATCRQDQRWTGATCRCLETGRLPLAMGGGRFADGTVRVERSASGRGELKLDPGIYQVVVSRGVEYDIQRRFVRLRPGMVTDVTASLNRVVDTRGWVSADFHVHGPNSVDGSALHRPRVTSFVAEGVELLSSSDHDYFTDYRATVFEMGVQRWLKTQVGVEVSPLDYGHFIGFPLKFDERNEQNAPRNEIPILKIVNGEPKSFGSIPSRSFHWRRGRTSQEMVSDPGGADWVNLSPHEIFARLRSVGTLGQKTVVFATHFYDYFQFYNMDPWTLDLPTGPLDNPLAIFNTTLTAENFSGAFDALEGFNGKNLDIIRRPTYAEIQDYNVKLAKFLVTSKDWDYDRRMRAWRGLSSAAQREFLRRSNEEQQKAISYSNDAFSCRCMADAECGDARFICDPGTAACVLGCKTDADCDATHAKDGRETCLATSTGSKMCQRPLKSCTSDSDCGAKFGTSGQEKCLARDSTKPSDKSCELACTTDEGCKGLDAMRPLCDAKAKVCVGVTAATKLDPCVLLRGTVDDWFQLLNRGVRRNFIGNSDTHGLYDVEAGCPRNFIRSDTDMPQGIRPDDVAAKVHAMQSFTTYGPFVELTIDGQPSGSIVKVPKLAKGQTTKVTLKLKVQSPLWFDVDRIEVYSNGQQVGLITSKPDCPAGSTACVQSPNKRVVNFDGTLDYTISKDAWFVVLVMGLDGKTLAPVYSSTPVARLGMFELMQRLTPLLPPLRALRTPLAPSMTTVRPYALTNPIWIDVGGDGLTPVAKLPPWATAKDKAEAKLDGGSSKTTSAPLSRGAKGHPAHNHTYGLGRLRDDARKTSLPSGGKLTMEQLQRAMNSLRYLQLGH